MTNPPEPTNLPAGVRRQADKLLAAAALTLLAVGTFAYRLMEDWSWVDSLYFSVVAVTTVGFGDLAPTTDGAKLFTVFYLISGITIISLWLNQRLQVRAKNLAGRNQRSRHQ